jgi:ABC-type spermidine/putrescine transport system permease subunit II
MNNNKVILYKKIIDYLTNLTLLLPNIIKGIYLYAMVVSYENGNLANNRFITYISFLIFKFRDSVLALSFLINTIFDISN